MEYQLIGAYPLKDSSKVFSIWGIGGGIITKKLLVVALLIFSLSVGGIAATSAADVNATQIQTSNTNNLNESIKTQPNSENIIKNSTITQKSVDKSVKLDKTKKHAHKYHENKLKVKPDAKNTSKSSANVQKNSITNSLTPKPEIINDANASISTHKESTIQNTSTVNNAKTSVDNSSVSETTKDTTQKPTTNSTTETTSSTQTTVEKPVTNQNSSQNVSSENPASNSIQNQSTQSNSVNTNELAAAGETKTPANFTVSQIKDAAARVKAYIETNKKLPSYVTIGTTQVAMPDFLKLLTAGLLQINSGSTAPVTVKTVSTPAKASESIKSGSIKKAGYLDLAKRVNAFINANGVLPNYAKSTLGKLRYESLIYMFSKVLNFQNTNNRLPSYVTVKAWSTVGSSSTTSNTSGSVSTPVPADLQIYLLATKNAQSNDPAIKALAAKITSGKTSTYDKAEAIFNWVRDNLAYSFYYNTKYGAKGALNVKKGKC